MMDAIKRGNVEREEREIREMGEEVEAGDDDGSGRVTLNLFG